MTATFSFPEERLPPIEEIRLACSHILAIYGGGGFTKRPNTTDSWTSDANITHPSLPGRRLAYDVSQDHHTAVLSLRPEDEYGNDDAILISGLFREERLMRRNFFPTSRIELLSDALSPESCQARRLMEDTVSTIIHLAGIASIKNTMVLLGDDVISLVCVDSAGTRHSHLFPAIEPDDVTMVHQLVRDHFRLGHLHIATEGDLSASVVKILPYSRPIPFGPMEAMAHIATLGPGADLRVPEFTRH